MGDAARIRRAGRPSNRHSSPLVLRIYDEARTAHLERLRSTRPGDFLYRYTRYDFDPAMAQAVGARRVSRLQAVWTILTSQWEIVELNEPGLIKAWPSTVAYALAARLRQLLSRKPRRIAFYAIENADIVENLSSFARIPNWAAHALVWSVLRTISPAGTRIAFGTRQARDQYLSIDSRLNCRTEVNEVPALSAPCLLCEPAAKLERIVFLGAFEERKGIRNVIHSWDKVHHQNPEAELYLLGKGPLSEEVRSWSSGRAEVALLEDPERDRIHAVLNTSKVLVLPSQRSHRWREQVGLPILEGLSHGCHIVTTDQTGIAPWLSEHGHRIVPASGSDQLDAALTAALRDVRGPTDIRADLPALDGRIEADHWMTRV